MALVFGLRGAAAPSAARGVLQAVPADAWLVVTIDVAAARPLLQPWLESAGGLARATRAAGLGSLTAACGFDPVEHLREIMVAAPEGGERGDFGVAFSADLTKDELAGCARKAIAARGGSPTTTARGGYVVIGDENAPTQARLAYRDRGPFLVGTSPWLDAMIDAAGSHAVGVPSRHLALRDALAPGGASRALVVTALLPKPIREKLGTSEADGDAGAAFTGVLGVAQAGAAVTALDATTTIEVELRCDTPAACEEVKELIEKGRRSLSGNLGVRLMGFGPLVDGVSFDAAAAGALAVRTRAPTAGLAQALERLWARVTPASGPSSPAAPAAAAAAADRGGAPSADSADSIDARGAPARPDR
jgi:hypothetical protein